ncbi:MAG: TPR repeats containing protein, partial [Halothiobacillaceae bacterium]
MINSRVNALIGGCLTACALLGSGSAVAISDAARQLQQQWDVAKYQTAKPAREKALEKLVAEAKIAQQKSANDAEVLVWEAIILSTYAGEKGGLGALSLVKEAKVLLESAEKIDATVLNGALYTSLGSLYYQVPGWPIGFGDSDKAQRYLQKALEMAPDDIDANFF